MKYTSIRILLAIVTQFDLKLEQVDINTAFLHGSLDESIYMTQPKDYEVKKKNLVCLLNKSLYGLKLATRQ